jgi:hypothetical protein
VALQQSELAYQYGWIQSPTLKQLFVWLITDYLDAGIKSFIKARRESLAGQPTEEGAAHGK